MPNNPNHSGPELAILIVTYNSAGDIGACLESIQEKIRTVSYELCIVDNASEDQTVSIAKLKFPAAKIITNSINLGFAKAINQAIKATSASFLFWLNPDSIITEGDASILLNYLHNNPKVGIIGVKIMNPDHSLQFSARSFPTYATAFFNRYSLLSRLFPNNPFTQKYLGTAWNHDTIQLVDWVSGAGLIHRRSLTNQLGLLDEKFFMYCEDVDFCLRAHKAHWEVMYHPGLVINHVIAGSSKGTPIRMIYERHRSIWLYYKKNFPSHFLMDVMIGFGITFRCLVLTTASILKRLFNAHG